ncbi:hypothetical protein BC830DRAFT_18239 [Chytriomyces sp. MP71]|nr:hypothetical protein BC830DRAFT_18239 [Chytriomyces sp. MP71]
MEEGDFDNLRRDMSLKSARGRKQACDLPEDRRQAMNRINGRNFRERKAKERTEMEQQLKEFAEVLKAKNAETSILKATIQQLEADKVQLVEALRNLNSFSGSLDSGMALAVSSNSEGSAVSCPACEVERSKAQFHQDSATSLKSALSITQKECNDLKKAVTEMQNQSMLNSILSFNGPWSGTSIASDFVAQTPMEAFNTFGASSPMQMDLAVASLLSTPSNDDLLWFDEGSMPLDLNFNQSAEALYGPMRIEFARFFLKSIHSLAEGSASKHADTYVDSLIQASKATDKYRIRKFFLRTIRTMHLMFDACATPAERLNVIDIFLSIIELNKASVDHILYRMVDYEPIVRKTAALGGYVIPPVTVPLNQRLKSLPSLFQSHDLIDEMCLIVGSTKWTAMDYVGMAWTARKLQSACNTQSDRQILLESIHSFRTSNPQLQMNKLEDIIRELDALAL